MTAQSATRRLRRAARLAALGAIAGAVATVPMSGPMLIAGEAGVMGRQPPRRLLDRAVGRPWSNKGERRHDAGSSMLHLALGALAGAAFGAVAEAARPQVASVAPAGGYVAAARDVAAGAAFGAALWAVNYAGIAPALDLLPPPSDDRPSRQATLLGAHLVFGAATALVLALEERVLPPVRDVR